MVLFAVIMTLLLAGTMIGFGYLFTRRPPRDINMLFGYRTPRSTKNKNTWDFAHRKAGHVWIRSGLVTVVLSAVFILAFRNSPAFSKLSLVLMYGQLAILLAVIPITEHALGRRFDSNGRLRDDNRPPDGRSNGGDLPRN